MKSNALLIASTAGLNAAVLISAKHCDDPGSFSNPGASKRASFRYWFPDATVDQAVVADDIARAGLIGAGGVEFVPFYEYGGELGPEPAGVDWSKYGFGTEPFKDHFRNALRAHADNGMLMDFAFGPSQGQGVPATPDDDGLQWDLVPFNRTIPSNGLHDEVIPGWGEGKLIALVSASVVNKSMEPVPAGFNSLLALPYTHYRQLVLDASNLMEHSDSVSKDGRVSIALSEANGAALESWIFAFYERKTLHRALHVDNNATETIFDDGSYVVDHFSAEGAKTVTDFWDNFLLDDEVRDLVKRVGQNGWEDSMEIKSSINWTPALLERFKIQHGYDLRIYLPLIMWANNNIGLQTTDPGRVRAILNTHDQGVGHVNDFRATLQLAYREYLTALSSWLRDTLGLTFRHQVSYNMPMEMGANIPFTDVPECESLGFKNSLDGYRQFTGPAALSQRPVVSNELGAVFLSAYRQSIPALLHAADIGFAAGVNRFVLHGQAYSGNYSQTTWPGHSPFTYFVSELNSRKHPSWEAGMPEAMEYLARTQYTQQSGVARADIAIYHHESATNFQMPTLYLSKDLSSAGYSYRYVAPDNFKLDTAYVDDGVLGPNGASFKALILMEGAALSLEGVENIADFARDGLPILITGEPVPFPSIDGSAEGKILEKIEALKLIPGVHQIANGTAAAELTKLGISPFVAVQANATWIVNQRFDARHGINYVFILGDAGLSQGKITVSTTGVPYIFDVWTGIIRPIIHYTEVSGSLVIPLRLAGQQTMVLGFSEKTLQEVKTPTAHIISQPAGVLASTYTEEEGLVLQLATDSKVANDGGEVILSTGRSLIIPESTTKLMGPFELSTWDLTVEHWEAPDDLYNAAATAVKRNTTHRLTAPLLSWTELDRSLHNASGLGFYNSSFTWNEDQRSNGAYLVLSEVLHAVRLFVNGEVVGPLDPRNPVLDISPYLRTGKNEVSAIVPSLMWNYIRTLVPNLETSGAQAFVSAQFETPPPLPSAVDNGLVGSVVIRPYRKYAIKQDI